MLVAYILWEIGGRRTGHPASYGLGFLRSTWDVEQGRFGILPEIWGTLYSSLLALLLGGFFGVHRHFPDPGFLPHRLATVFRTIVELLAAIPASSTAFGASTSSSR